jgi:hypothetical protein
MKKIIIGITVIFSILFAAININAQTNLLVNPNADSKSEHWKTFKDELIELFEKSNKYQKVAVPNKDYLLEQEQKPKQAIVEEFNGNNAFIVRNKGYFYQDVNLTESDIGKFALLIGHGSSERINTDGAITGLPYLYGRMMNTSNPKESKTHAFLQAREMLARTSYQDQWVTMFGVFRISEGTGAIRFYLKQAERRDVPQNGSTARFDNLGLYLFGTEKEALEFAKAYK